MSRAADGKLVAPGQGRTVELFAVRFHYMIESADSGGSLAVLQIEIPPGTLVKPHNHTREDEFSLILAGTVGVRLGERVLQAPAGSYLAKPRGIPHAMWNNDSQPATVVEMLSPGGLERYFEELVPVLAHEGGAGPKEYYELAQRYGLEIMDDWIEELERTYGVKL